MTKEETLSTSLNYRNHPFLWPELLCDGSRSPIAPDPAHYPLFAHFSVNTRTQESFRENDQRVMPWLISTV
jgi:hypothetical protein